MEPQLISRGDTAEGFAGPLFVERLQWSPSSSAGETARHDERDGVLVVASMEPQLISRGDSRTQGGVGLPHTPRFNGAPAHQPGRLAPRTPPSPPRQRASMEPQLISRGDLPATLDGAPLDLASMEPQLISRGDRGGVRATAPREALLQWSPSSSAGETSEPVSTARRKT